MSEANDNNYTYLKRTDPNATSNSYYQEDYVKFQNFMANDQLAPFPPDLVVISPEPEPEPEPGPEPEPEPNKKILCLHGGGDSAQGLSNQTGMIDLINALPNFDFVFIDSPIDGGVWWLDPPGGKDNPSTNENWADTSLTYIENYINTYGPFYALLGYSQGAAMIPVFLSYKTNITFEKVLMFSGYLPTTHVGLMSTINSNSPLSTRALIFLGQNDIFFYTLGLDLKNEFSNYEEIISSSADHHLPYNTDTTFINVVNFIEPPEPEPEPQSESTDETKDEDEIQPSPEPEPEPEPSAQSENGIIFTYVYNEEYDITQILVLNKEPLYDEDDISFPFTPTYRLSSMTLTFQDLDPDKNKNLSTSPFDLSKLTASNYLTFFNSNDNNRYVSDTIYTLNLSGNQNAPYYDANITLSGNRLAESSVFRPVFHVNGNCNLVSIRTLLATSIEPGYLNTDQDTYVIKNKEGVARILKPDGTYIDPPFEL